MAKKDALKETSRQHTVYKLADGTRVPGVTTVISVLAKPQLIAWANRLGLEGVDSSAYTDTTARIGTLAHAMVQAHLSDTDVDLTAYSSIEIDRAENSFLSYLAWEKNHTIEPLELELPLVSNAKYGGTCDIIAIVDGELNLIDLKSGSGIFDEMLYQCASYVALVEENNIPFNHGFTKIKQARILNIPRKETEGFTERIYDRAALEIGYEVFSYCLKIYELQKKIKGGI